MKNFRKPFLIASSVIFLLTAGSFTEKAAENAPKIGNENELHWMNFNEGYSIAKKNKKIALIDTYTDWCGWCKKMDRDTYTNPEVISKINKHFIPIKFNPEIRDVKYNLEGKEYTGFELHSIISNRHQSGYPTTYFIITKKNRVMIEEGYQDPKNFLATLDKIIAESEN